MESLVARAKRRTGFDSDTDLIDVTLANIAVGDDYVALLKFTACDRRRPNQ
jgi:hypothetical protein